MAVQDYQPRIFENFRHVLLENKLSHAYLFSGSFGAFDMALLLGKTIFCQNKQEGYACGVCRTCQMIADNDFPDLKIIEPVGNIIKTDSVRELVGEFAKSGFESKAQVFIIKESDKMHANAANSLLKMIEEPTSDSYVFLLTDDDSKLLQTIRSRCQIVRFPTNKAYLSKILEQEGILKNQAKLLSELAKDIEDAKQMAKSPKLLDLLKNCQNFVHLWLKKDSATYLEATRLSLMTTEKSEQEQVFKLLVCLLGQEPTRLSLATYLSRVEQAKRMWQANVSLQNALEYMVLSD